MTPGETPPTRLDAFGKAGGLRGGGSRGDAAGEGHGPGRDDGPVGVGVVRAREGGGGAEEDA